MNTLIDLIKASTNDFERVEVELSLENTAKTIKSYLEEVAFYKNDLELNEIYISVMLTLLNQLTLPKADLDKLSKMSPTACYRDTFLYMKVNDNLNLAKPIVIGNYEPAYIAVLTKLVKSALIEELSYTTDYSVDESDLAQVLIEEELANNVKTEEKNKPKTNNNK